jgi:hypothetical protein
MQVSAQTLASLVIRRHGEIEDRLRNDRALDAFQGRIGQWSETHLGKDRFEAEATAQALWEILDEFGLSDLLAEPEAHVAVAVGVLGARKADDAVRTRGAAPLKRAGAPSRRKSSPQLVEEMSRVAALFRRA